MIINIDELSEVACALINKNSLETAVNTPEDLRFWAWQQTFSSTNPFGIGGQMMTTMTVYAFDGMYGDGALCVMGRWQYVKDFTPLMRFNTRALSFNSSQILEEKETEE